jgi:endonuclease/exonuclease/phosphatase family metal-dependent hydrolase
MHLRLLSWNIHKCVGGIDRRYDPARTAALLAQAAPDLVLLQEVGQKGTWYRGERQVDVLGDLLGFQQRSYFVNVRFGEQRGEYGNAILSRYPITATENIDLTIGRRKARSVLHAALRIPVGTGGRALHVFNMHLGLGERERRQQLEKFLQAEPFANLRPTTPIVVAGDFNDVWGTIGKRLLVPAGFIGMPRPVRTFPAWAPMRALDSVYLRGDVHLQHINTLRTAVARRASDHLPLLAQLDVK